MPFCASRSALTRESFQFELPPSTTMSPLDRRSPSSWMTASVTWAGTITQATRRAVSFPIASGVPSAKIAPLARQLTRDVEVAGDRDDLVPAARAGAES